MNRKFDVILGSGAALISFLVSVLVLTGIVMLTGMTMHPWIFFASLIIAMFAGYLLGNWYSVMLSCAVIGLCILIGGITFDCAVDSITYHGTTIMLTNDGWNYVYDQPDSTSLCVKHYARAQEMLAASVIAVTGIIESGKAVNLIFLCGCFLLSLAFLLKLYPWKKFSTPLFITLVLSLNPVSIVQSVTFYNDMFLYSGILTLILGLMYLFKNDNKWINKIVLCITAMISVILINTKFTHFFYCGLVWVIFYIILLVSHRTKLLRQTFFVGLASLIIGIFIVGFNPYITNIIETGDPFFPLLTGNFDIMSYNTPPIYDNSDRFINFFKAQLSTEQISWAVLKQPLAIENYITISIDARTKGFGPLYFLLLLLSITLMFVAKANKFQWSAFVGTILICFIFPQSWWARYTPFAWGVIGISVWVSYLSSKGEVLRRIIIILVLLNSTFAFVRGCAQSFIGGRQWENFLSITAKNPVKVCTHDNKVMKWHLEQANVNYIEVPIETLDPKHTYVIIGRGNNPFVPLFEMEVSEYEALSPLQRTLLQYSRKAIEDK